MANQTETFNFTELPLTVSGNTTVASVSGTAEWRLKEDGSLLSLMILNLYGDDGSLVEVFPGEYIYPAILRALEGAATTRANASKKVDNDVTEGAPSET